MRKIFILLLSLISLNIMAQQVASEVSPDIKLYPENIMGTDTFNLQFNFPCVAFIGEYGVESNGTDLYVTQWRDDSIARYDVSGNVVETFEISGVGEVRDMAFDGQYYYGSPNDFFFYIMDLDNKSLVEKVLTAFKIRGMAYDAIEDVLWATEMWNPDFVKMDMDGNIIDSWVPSGITLGAISGLAYDNDSQNGPFLWGFSQDSTGAIIVKYDINTQTQTGNMIDVSGLVSEENSVAGGLYMREMSLRSDVALGGLIQNQVVFGFELDYANSLVEVENNFISQMKIYPNPASDYVVLEFGETDKPVSMKLLDSNGKIIKYSDIDDSRYNVDISNLPAGLYFIELSQTGRFNITKKILVQ